MQHAHPPHARCAHTCTHRKHNNRNSTCHTAQTDAPRQLRPPTPSSPRPRRAACRSLQFPILRRHTRTISHTQTVPAEKTGPTGPDKTRQTRLATQQSTRRAQTPTLHVHLGVRYTAPSHVFLPSIILTTAPMQPRCQLTSYRLACSDPAWLLSCLPPPGRWNWGKRPPS